MNTWELSSYDLQKYIIENIHRLVAVSMHESLSAREKLTIFIVEEELATTVVRATESHANENTKNNRV